MARGRLDRQSNVRTSCSLFVAWLIGGRVPALSHSECRMTVRIDRSEEGDFLWVVEERKGGRWCGDLQTSEHQFLTYQGALCEGQKVLNSLLCM